MSTSFPPQVLAHIYLALPCSLLETRENAKPVTLTISGGSSFPANLGSIIKQIERVISYEKSDIVGKKSDDTTVCQGVQCMGYTADESITYSMKPLYPPQNTFLSEYKPKIGLVKFLTTLMTLPPQDRMSTATPLSQNEFAIFRITYNVLLINTSDATTKFKDSILKNGHYLRMLNETKFFEHNMAVVQKIQKMNNVSSTVSKSDVQNEMMKQTGKPLQTQSYQSPQKKDISGFLNKTFSPDQIKGMGTPPPGQSFSVKDFQKIGITFPPGQMPSQSQLRQMSQQIQKQ